MSLLSFCPDLVKYVSVFSSISLSFLSNNASRFVKVLTIVLVLISLLPSLGKPNNSNILPRSNNAMCNSMYSSLS